MRRFFVISTVLLACCAINGCGGNSSTTQPVSHLQYRAFIANSFQKVLHIVDESKDQLYVITDPNTLLATPGNIAITESTVGVPSTPVALVPAGTAITVVATHDTFGDSLSFVGNATELQTAAVALPSQIYSTVATSDGKTAYAAVPDSSQVSVVDIATAAITASISVNNAQRLVLAPDNSKILAFTPNRAGFALIKTADNSVQTVPGFTSAVYGVFSSDGSKAYILSCSAECGASTPATVTMVDVSGATPVVGASVTVPAATVGLVDSNGNLYIAGSPTIGPAAGVLTVVNTSGMTITKTVPIGDGNHNLMVLAANGKLYIGAQTCTDQVGSSTPTGCLTIYNVSGGTATIDVARGDVSAVQPVTAKGRNVIYTVIGGQLIIFDGGTDMPQATQIPLTGQITDVKSAQ